MSLESYLLSDEKVMYDIKPSGKAKLLWGLPLVLMLFLGPLGVFLAFFFIKERAVRMLYFTSIIVGIAVSLLILFAILAIPSLGLAMAFIPVILALVYLVFFYLGLTMIYGKIRLVLTDRRAIFFHGFVTDFIHSVAYDRISDVKITSGAYESALGLKSIILETLSGQRLTRRKGFSLGDVLMEGLTPEDLREIELFLFGKMKKAPLES